VRQQPLFPKAYRNLGRAYYAVGNFDAAIEVLQTAITQRQGNFAEAYYDLGLARFSKGQFDDAIMAQQKAIEQSRERAFPEAHFCLASAYRARGDAARLPPATQSSPPIALPFPRRITCAAVPSMK
jgi:tetratricopeptide (TPR) repeat protein